ncbi:alpha/beta fold hydrolase, partial [Streptomyces sp. NPDC002491]
QRLPLRLREALEALREHTAVEAPTLVLWGESDRIATPAYGKEYAASFGNARFETVAEAGHLPHLEQPARTFALLDAFAAQTGGRSAPFQDLP